MNESHLGEELHAYVDNELGVERAIEVRSHLDSCTRCQRRFVNLREFRRILQRTLQPTEPSTAFLRQLRHAIRRADPERRAMRARSAAGWTVGPLVATAVLVFFALKSSPPRMASNLTDEVVAAHLRSLEAEHLTDVASSDRHTVKPWFQGKLPFSPPVRDFGDQGYSLQGGRLDYLNGRPVAALIYRAGQHVINVFVWPAGAETDSAPRPATRSGLNSLHWVSNGMVWFLVSDMGEADLEGLASLLRETPK